MRVIASTPLTVLEQYFDLSSFGYIAALGSMGERAIVDFGDYEILVIDKDRKALSLSEDPRLVEKALLHNVFAVDQDLIIKHRNRFAGSAIL